MSVRKSRDRKSYLVLDQELEVINALAFSETQKRRLNTAMTIVWRHSAGFDEAEWSSRECDLWKKVRGWLKRHGVEHRCIWVRENGQHKGLHLHAFLHVPDKLRKQFADFFVLSERLGGGGLVCKRSSTGKQHRGFLRYLMKTADPTDTHYEHGKYVNVSETLGIIHNGRKPLPVSIQRYGVTANLGPKARKAAGFADADTASEASSLLGDIAIAGSKAPPAVVPLRATVKKATTARRRRRTRAATTFMTEFMTHLGDDSRRDRGSLVA